MRVLAVLFLSILHPILCYEEMDKANDPILRYLKINPDHVSKRKLVKIGLPERLHKRDLDGRTLMKIQAFDNDDYIHLWLAPADAIFVTDETPVWREDSTQTIGNLVNYVRVRDAMKNVGRLMKDEKRGASVVIGSDNYGKTTVNGVLLRSRRDNTRLVIRSLPEDVVRGYLNGSIEESGDDTAGSSRHVLFELLDDDAESYGLPDDRQFESEPISESPNRERRGVFTANRRRLSSIVYPRILIQVDSSYPKLQSSEDLTHFLEYLLAYWNSVNMIFAKIDYPKFRLNIAGFVIAENLRTTPFIMFHMMENHVIDADAAIEHSKRFWHGDAMSQTFPTSTYDVLVTMTLNKISNSEHREIVGVASVGDICKYQSDAISGVSILHDDGGSFSTTVNAAHELGHIFGLSHDDDYGDPRCGADRGFLMTAGVSSTKNAREFSVCSLNSLRNFYENGDYECMQRVPAQTGNRLPIPLAGKTKSLDEQCAALGYARLCSWGERDVCASLYCMRETGGTCSSAGVGAAPGSSCGKEGESKICVNNRCVEEAL